MQLKNRVGGFSFIIPGKFLNNKQFAATRKLISKGHDINVVKIDDKVFETQVDSVIIQNHLAANPNKPKYRPFKISGQEVTLLSTIDVSQILQNDESIFILEVNKNIDTLIDKIKKETFKVIEIADVKDGIVAGAIKDLLFLDKKKDKDSKKIYFGKHISKYHLKETEMWVNYKPDEMMKEEVKRQGDKRTGLWMRDEKIFNREKIIYRKVGKELIATFDEKGIYYEQTIHSCHITDKRFEPKYILGLFNSQLFKFYYRKTNSQGGDVFPQVRISSVENLPIKLANNKTQDKIVSLVDEMLELHKKISKIKNPDEKTRIQRQIDATDDRVDKLVYELYGLTDEEIKIVEGIQKG
jgi:hypothetical protein